MASRRADAAPRSPRDGHCVSENRRQNGSVSKLGNYSGMLADLEKCVHRVREEADAQVMEVENQTLVLEARCLQLQQQISEHERRRESALLIPVPDRTPEMVLGVRSSSILDATAGTSANSRKPELVETPSTRAPSSSGSPTQAFNSVPAAQEPLPCERGFDHSQTQQEESPETPPPHVKSLVICGFPSDASKTQMRRAFSPFGGIESVSLSFKASGRSYGIVRFLTRFSSELALDACRCGEVIVEDRCGNESAICAVWEREEREEVTKSPNEVKNKSFFSGMPEDGPNGRSGMPKSPWDAAES